MLSKLLCAKRRKSHNSTKYCESIIKSVEIKQMAVQHHSYDQHLSQFWNHLVKYFRTGRPIQTDNSNGIGGGRTTRQPNNKNDNNDDNKTRDIEDEDNSKVENVDSGDELKGGIGRLKANPTILSILVG